MVVSTYESNGDRQVLSVMYVVNSSMILDLVSSV